MEITTICLVLCLLKSCLAHGEVSLKVSPFRSQFFKYSHVHLSCEGGGNSARVMRKHPTPHFGPEPCGSTWGKVSRTSCTIPGALQVDNGVYWCESGSDKRSNTLNIIVTDGPVLLESPVLPVAEGDAVNLICWYKDNTREPSSNLPADFYKDGSLIRSESTGQTTIHRVSKSDEGTYKCKNNHFGESPESWLAVHEIEANHTTPAVSPVLTGTPVTPPVSLVLAGLCSVLLIGFVVLLVVASILWRIYKGKAAPPTIRPNVSQSDAPDATVDLQPSAVHIYDEVSPDSPAGMDMELEQKDNPVYAQVTEHLPTGPICSKVHPHEGMDMELEQKDNPVYAKVTKHLPTGL